MNGRQIYHTRHNRQFIAKHKHVCDRRTDYIHNRQFIGKHTHSFIDVDEQTHVYDGWTDRHTFVSLQSQFLLGLSHSLLKVGHLHSEFVLLCHIFTGIWRERNMERKKCRQEGEGRWEEGSIESNCARNKSDMRHCYM